MYYIYHIKGKKIGCSDNVDFRVKSQGFCEYQILETHNDIMIASKREIQLQKQYGYPVDKIPYYLTISYCSKAGKKGGPAGKGVKSAGRSLKGERNNKAKLKQQDVFNIIEMTNSGKYLQKDIAEMYNVDRQTIRRITQNKMWKHLKEVIPNPFPTNDENRNS